MRDRLEAIDGASWEAFLGAPWAVLMLGKTDCEHCQEYTEKLHVLSGRRRPGRGALADLDVCCPTR